MWTNSSRGTKPNHSGSRWSSLFLLALLAFLPCSLSAQSQPAPANQQTPHSGQYSKMTQAELLTLIEQKDSLINEWVARGKQWQVDKQNLQGLSDKQDKRIADLMTSLQDQKQASEADKASRDKFEADQAIVINERTQERDDARDALTRQKIGSELEKWLYGLAGGGLGYAAGRLTK